MQSRQSKLMRLNACSYLLLIFGLLVQPYQAQADLLLESQAGQNGVLDFAAALQLRIGTIKGTRNRATHDDVVKRYHGALGLAWRYRFLYVVPELEFHYVDIETTRTEGQLRSAKLRSGGLRDGEAFKNVSLGGTLGAALPASLLDGFEVLQLGAFVDGRTTLTAPQLTFDELMVVYKGHRLDMKDQGNAGAVRVHYRWWTVAWGGFLTLRFSELPPFAQNTPVLRPVARAVQRSALSISGGILHFRLKVNVEVDESFAQYVEEDQSQYIKKDRPFLRVRYAIPVVWRLGVEVGGSATKKNGDWLYEGDALLGFRF